MVYKKKITVLSGIIAALAVVYILTFIFDPERMSSRSDLYSWLESRLTGTIDGINIVSAEETITLVRKNDNWFVSHAGKDYPARQSRIDDFIALFTKRAPYPVRSTSASSHERLSLNEENATLITLTGGTGSPLLNLLIGQEDISGQNVYLRKQELNEVRSGENIFSAYTGSPLNSWYNLRLFPDSESGRLDVVNIQRLTVYPPADENGEAKPPQVFTRSGRTWTFNFDIENPDMSSVDNYIRDILNTMGDDFIDTVNSSDPMFDDSRIVLELGDSSIKTIRLGPSAEDGRRYATVTGSDMVYSLPAWVNQRLFTDTGSFETN